MTINQGRTKHKNLETPKSQGIAILSETILFWNRLSFEIIILTGIEGITVVRPLKYT